MSSTSVKGFDRTVHESNTWLHEISEAMGDPRPSIAYHALRGTLTTLRDRLPVGEVFDLAAQLPMLIRGLYFEGYQPENKPLKFDRDEFLNRVQRELQAGGGANVEDAVRAVLHVLQAHVDEGELQQVRAALPADLRSLWPDVPTS